MRYLPSSTFFSISDYIGTVFYFDKLCMQPLDLQSDFNELRPMGNWKNQDSVGCSGTYCVRFLSVLLAKKKSRKIISHKICEYSGAAMNKTISMVLLNII